MPSPFQSAGAAVEPSKAAALHVNRMFTGLWTQRNPLRDAATPYLYEKFYSATRYDGLLDGLNTELSVRLTLVRRPGSSMYNTSLIPPVRRYYAFRTFVGTTELIRVVADCWPDPTQPTDLLGTIRDVTGPDTNTILAFKTGTAAASFLSIGNTLYWTDGANPMEWNLSANVWTANTTIYTSPYWIIDPNGNQQLAIMGNVASPIAQLGAVQQTGGQGIKMLLVFTLTGPSPNYGPVPGAGTTAMQPLGLTAHPTLNGIYFPLFNDPSYPAVAGQLSNQVIVDATGTVGTPFASATETGTITGPAPGGGYTTGATQPTWNTTVGGLTYDGQVIWQNKGEPIHAWGISGPTTAPTLAQIPLPTIYEQWNANTIYGPNELIVDSNSNIQQLTHTGTTGTTAPASWATAPGATTTDGTAVWTCQGPAAWQASHAYALGTYIAVTFTITYTVTTYEWNGHQNVPVTQTYTTSVSDFFKCTTAGTSGATMPANWQQGVGLTVTDNTVVWTNLGTQRTWANVGPSLTLSDTNIIVDTNGNLETVVVGGKSGATAPTWATTQGAQTQDGTVTWQTGAPYSAPNSQAWTYAYAWKNSITAHVSTASPLSLPIVRAADSQIVIQGVGSTDPQVDTVVIYRTLQGGSILFWLAEIPAPKNGATWTYTDSSPDPTPEGTGNSTINQFIQAQISSSNNPPPANLTALQYHMGHIWGFVGNVLRYSNGPDTLSGNGNEAWPPLNNFVYPANGTYLWPTSLGLAVFTLSDMALVPGQGTSASPFYSIPFQAGIGLLTADAFGINGSTAYVMTTDRRLLSLDPSAGEIEVGFPVGDKFFALYDPSNVNVTWHQGKSADTALYVADNEAGWFRMSAISAPESGDLWSPRAVIAGGTSAVRSIEVSPGEKRLLIGPPSGTLGPILQRDDTIYTDNENPYSATADIGCIVLAQPGSIAGVHFITTDAVKIGNRPGIGILLGELSGTFEMLPRSRQDPPLLPVADTVYSDRYYALPSQEPAWCRFMQLQVDFGQDQVANELLTYTIFGSIENEVMSHA